MGVRNAPLQVLRSRLAIIQQEPTLFRGTLRYNLSPLLSENFLNATFKLDADLEGMESRPPRWKKCVGAVKHALPGLTDELYVTKLFPKKADEDAHVMMSQLRVIGLLRHMTSTNTDITPFVVNSDRLYYHFYSPRGGSRAWGYRVVISPIWKLQWLREEQVLTSPSLEWGCWLMHFLMREAPAVADTGALHDPRIFNSLVRYLRTAAVPYKQRVIDLIAQLLIHGPGTLETGDRPVVLSMPGQADPEVAVCARLP